MTNQQLQKIRLLLLDVDGVLTAGEIIYGDTGEQFKVFNAKDGLGIRLLQEAGIQVGIVTARTGEALRHRCNNLNIHLIFDGIHQKAKALDKASAKTGLVPEAIAFVGDDLFDLSIMKKVGLAVAVADAHDMVRQTAHWVTHAPGGRGAVREVCEAILKAQNRWDEVIKNLFDA